MNNFLDRQRLKKKYSKRTTNEVPKTTSSVVCVHETKVFKTFQGWCVKCGKVVPVCQTCGTPAKAEGKYSFVHACNHNKNIRISVG